jgi:hypothetical protein
MICVMESNNSLYSITEAKEDEIIIASAITLYGVWLSFALFYTLNFYVRDFIGCVWDSCLNLSSIETNLLITLSIVLFLILIFISIKASLRLYSKLALIDLIEEEGKEKIKNYFSNPIIYNDLLLFLKSIIQRGLLSVFSPIMYHILFSFIIGFLIFQDIGNKQLDSKEHVLMGWKFIMLNLFFLLPLYHGLYSVKKQIIKYINNEGRKYSNAI